MDPSIHGIDKRAMGKVKVSEDAREAVLKACLDFDDDHKLQKEKVTAQIQKRKKDIREAANTVPSSKNVPVAVAWGADKKHKKGISIEKTLQKISAQPGLWSGGAEVKNMP